MNTQLENNNTSLEEVLAMVNSLPESGSGGGDSSSGNILESFTRNTYIIKNRDAIVDYGMVFDKPTNLYVEQSINPLPYSNFSDKLYYYPVNTATGKYCFESCDFNCSDIKICCDFGLPSNDKAIFCQCGFHHSSTTIYVPWNEGEYIMYEDCTFFDPETEPNIIYNYNFTESD